MNENIPYVGINRILKIIKNFPNGNSSDVEELYTQYGKSNISNLTPTLKLLKLIEYNTENKTISLSELGIQLKTNLITNNTIEASKIIKNSIKNSELFKFIKLLLEKEKRLTTEDIGRNIALKYKKQWNNLLTFKTHGSAIASILSFSGYGTFKRSVLYKGIPKNGDSEFDRSKDLVLPSGYFNIIYKITKTVSILKETDLSTLTKELGKKAATCVAVCCKIGLIRRVSPNVFKITQKGNELTSEFNKNKISETWEKILMESDYNRLILLLQEKELNPYSIGEFLNRHIGGKWTSEITIIDYGKRFLNWLKTANLVEKVDKNAYKMKNISDFHEKGIENTESINLNDKDSKIITDYYMMGKIVEYIRSNNNQVDEINQNIKKLIKICEKNEIYDDVINLLKGHYHLFNDIKDKRIFYPDFSLLENKLGINIKN